MECKHEFIYSEEKNDKMLSGYERIGRCKCGARTMNFKHEIRFILNKLVEWDKKVLCIEDLTPADVVRLVIGQKAVNDYHKFTEDHAQEWLNNLDKCI